MKCIAHSAPDLGVFCLVMLTLAACGGAGLPQEPTHVPTETEPPTAQEPGDPSRDCSSSIRPNALGKASSEELALVKEVLDNIRPGTTTLDEVAQLLGEPVEIARGGTEEHWVYDYTTSDPRGTETWGVNVNVVENDGSKVAANLVLSNAMSLAQLIELLGDPSKVYRFYSRDVGEPWTLLIYDEHSMTALIWEALCPGDYPADVTVTRIFVEPPGTPGKEVFRISSEDVEMEWTGITTDG